MELECPIFLAEEDFVNSLHVFKTLLDCLFHPASFPTFFFLPKFNKNSLNKEFLLKAHKVLKFPILLQ